jgi:SPP1 family predicted phage head-tail adaptor
MYNKREQAGELRHRIRLVQYTTERTSSGAERKSWIASNETWAKVEQRVVGSEEDDIAQRITPTTNTIVRIRYKSTVGAQMRVLWQGKLLEIENVIQDAKRQFLDLVCFQLSPDSLDAWADESNLFWEDENGDWWQWDGSNDNINELEAGESFTDSAGLIWTKR